MCQSRISPGHPRGPRCYGLLERKPTRLADWFSALAVFLIDDDFPSGWIISLNHDFLGSFYQMGPVVQ